MSNIRVAKILVCILVVTAIISIRIYAADYIEVYTRDNVPSSIPTRGWPYASIDVWRYTDGTSFIGGGGLTGGDPLTKHPYYPGVGVFIQYAWTSSFTDVEYRVHIYRFEGGDSWVLVATMRPRAWMWPNGNYGGSWAYSGYVKRIHP
jgi:hypothetical protein